MADNKKIKNLISDYVKESISPEERGAALTLIASTYMQATNQVKQGYLDALKDVRAIFGDIEKKRKEAEKKADIKILKEQIKQP